MRNLMCLILGISGFAVGGSNSGSSGETNVPITMMDPAMATDAGDGSGGGGGGTIDIPDEGSGGGADVVPFPECPREQIPAEFTPYAGELTLTMSEYTACSTMCGQDESCYVDANCPGIEAFNDCFNTEVIGCSAGGSGMCRKEYENFVCCADSFQCAPDDQTCVMTNCANEIAMVAPCVQGDRTCLQQGGAKCLAPEPAPGSEPAPAPAGGGTTIPTASLRELARSLNALR